MSKDYKHANPEMAKAMHGLRSSSAATPHQDRRTRRSRSRQDSKRNEIRRSINGQ